MQETQQKNDQIWSTNVLYIPSSLEKKRAILMYLFFGIIVFIVDKKEMSIFEYFHLRQALWLSVLFILFFIPGVVLLFLPIIKYISLFVIVVFVSLWVMFVFNAWNWKYVVLWWENSPLAIFKWIWQWVINLFELQIKVFPSEEIDTKNISSLNDLIK